LLFFPPELGLILQIVRREQDSSQAVQAASNR
jgi:hypothetical protein